MAVVATDLVLNLTANTPDDDTSTVGGARAAAKRPVDVQLTANDTVDAVSSNAGDTTQTLTVEGRLVGGAVDTEALALNGTTPVTGAKTWERILSYTLSATCAGTVTVTDGDTGQGTIHTFPPGETFAAIGFRKSFSTASPKTYWEKNCWYNSNGTDTLNSAEVTLTADPSGNIRIALETAKDATTSAANRLTTPTPIGTITDDSVAISVPGGNLAATEYIGVWVEMQLAADEAATKSSYTLQLAGTTV